MDEIKRGWIDAYLTVEATLLMPIVLAVVLLIMDMWFFKYDRALMQQDFAMLTVETVKQQGVGAKERYEKGMANIANLYTDEYFAWKWGSQGISISGNKVELTASGETLFPYSGLDFWSARAFEAEAKYTGQVIDKVFGIRAYRKVKDIFSEKSK